MNLPVNAGDTNNTDLIPVSRRCPGLGNDNLLQYSCLENSMDRGTWQEQREAPPLLPMGLQRVGHD